MPCATVDHIRDIPSMMSHSAKHLPNRKLGGCWLTHIQTSTCETGPLCKQYIAGMGNREIFTYYIFT